MELLQKLNSQNFKRGMTKRITILLGMNFKTPLGGIIMSSVDKATVYMVLGISFMVGGCIFTSLVLNYLEKSSAIKAGLIQELRTENDVTRVIWVKDKND